MPPTPPNRADTIFGDALDLPPGEREAHLVAACGDDGDLLAEVQALLAAHEAVPTEFLSGDNPDMDATIASGGSGQTSGKPAGPVPGSRRPATRPAAAASPSEMPGELIGRYKLLQEIGEGGFGTVWMAEQTEPVTRRVALKIIKLGMDTKEVIARFEAERQALAMMDDENIAKVFDAGATDKGRPYFVMELVKGIPITQYCDEAGLSTRERLALFCDVCSAIQHAHQKGIIHRDIKPNNVMVTLHGDKPVVKVIDFGIAKATQGKLTEKTLFTHFDQVIGTPVYMSPEQASLSGLDIDTRSDIYALGVLLYELLTGKPPFDAKTLLSAGYEEMRRIIREDEPPKPSVRLSTVSDEDRTDLAKVRKIDPEKLSRLFASDLDWIVMKAIDKDRGRRYETANAFGQDIGAFLADEPVTATPPSAGYKLRKFARRNKAVIGVAAVITVLLLGGIAATSWQAVRANGEAERATAEAGRATAAEGLAEDRLVESEAAREDAEATSNFLIDMFLRSRPGAEKGGREIKVADVLDDAVKTLEANTELPSARRATLQATLGSTYDALGLPEEALPLQEKVRDYYLTAPGYGPEHPDTLNAMGHLATSYEKVDRVDEALEMQEKVLDLHRKVLGADHPDTPRHTGRLATYYQRAGRVAEAIEMQEKLLDHARKVSGPEHPDTLSAMNNLAISIHAAGRTNEALKMREEGLALSRKVLGPEHPDTLTGMSNLIFSYRAAGRLDDALKMGEELLSLRRKVSGPEHLDTRTAMNYLVDSYQKAGRLDDAIQMQEEVLAVRRKVLGPEHPDTLKSVHNLAASYQKAGRTDDVIPMQEELLPLVRKMFGPEHPNTLSTMAFLAFSYQKAGRLDDAIPMQEEVLALRRKVSGPEHPETLTATNNLAFSYQKVGRLDKAIPMQEEVLPLYRKVSGPKHSDTLRAMIHLANSYDAAGRKDEAKALREEMKKLRRKAPGPGNPK